MLIATQGTSVHATRQYFDQVLTQGDYYLGQEINGQWHGHGADDLGLGRGNDVTKDQFTALLQGRHPVDGKSLTQRNRKDRRPGMDLTFSVPKTVSLAWAINGDERLIDALRETVRETMTKDVEPLMQRRVRSGEHTNSEQKATTGKLIYADFLHKTSRPVDGKPDPHLHIHAFVINWTQQDGKHYAGQFEEIVRQRPSLQAKFEARLARKLQNELGYTVEQSRYRQSGRLKSGWEIAGLERATIEKFSRRTAQVEAFAKENGVTDAAAKGKLGKKTREQKDKGTSVDRLRSEWTSRLTEQERQAFARLLGGKTKTDGRSEQEAAMASLKYALAHHLYRQSTVERHQVVGTALEHGLTLRPETVEATLDRMNVLQRSLDVEGAKRHMVTTREVLDAEKQLIEFARDGRGTRKAINAAEYEFSRDWLNDQQKAAVSHVLQSRDTVMAVTGGAGTGKSSLLEEAAEAIRKSGKEVYTFAPSTGACEVLQSKGFAEAKTVEHLIRNETLHEKLRGQVLWIDEAGLLDVRSMNEVFRIAKQCNTRVVLSGDTRQHSSPRRGEAMRMLENEAGLRFARVETIQRQKAQYRQAVEMISKGHEVVDERTGKSGLIAGFDLLDSMGKIKEISHEARHTELANSYMTALEKGQSTLVVAPTHTEAKVVTDEIRRSLRYSGSLSGEERPVTQLKSLNLTEAEKGQQMTYQGGEGFVVQFHQNTKGGFKRGDRYRVTGTENGTVKIATDNGNVQKTLPLAHPDRFEIYSESKLSFAAGDKVRFSLGGTTNDGKRISNGRLDEITGFDRDGNLRLRSGGVVAKDYGHLDLGYVITSHASQGKDRHLAIAAMGAESLPAINAKQFYVTVSRGSEDVMLYVDDKAKVRRAIERSGTQLSATDLIRSADAVASPEETSKDRDCEAVREKQSQNAFRSFRDRVLHWWKNRGQERATQTPAGPHRDGMAGPMMGLGPMTPSLGRSR